MYFFFLFQKKLEKVKNKNFKKEVGNMIKAIDILKVFLNNFSERYYQFRYEKRDNR